MGANIAGIYGAQIFREDDRPRYRSAFAVACAVLAFGLFIAVGRYADDKIFKHKKARQVDEVLPCDAETPPSLSRDYQPSHIVSGDSLR